MTPDYMEHGVLKNQREPAHAAQRSAPVGITPDLRDE